MKKEKNRSKFRSVSFPAREKARVIAMGILIRSRFRWHMDSGRGWICAVLKTLCFQSSPRGERGRN